MDGWSDPSIKHLLRLCKVNNKAVNEYICRVHGISSCFMHALLVSSISKVSVKNCTISLHSNITLYFFQSQDSEISLFTLRLKFLVLFLGTEFA